MNYVAFDTNIFVYAANEDDFRCNSAKNLIRSVYERKIPAVITYQNMTEFYGVSTNKKTVSKHLEPKEARERVENFLWLSNFKLIYPNKKTGIILTQLIKDLKPIGQLIHDYFLAAILMSNGVNTLITENVKNFEGIKGFKAMEIADTIG